MVAAHIVINGVFANSKELTTGCFIMTVIILNIFTTYRNNGSKSYSFYNVHYIMLQIFTGNTANKNAMILNTLDSEVDEDCNLIFQIF